MILTGAGRALSLTERTARKLPKPASVFELDVTEPEHLVSARNAVAELWPRVDGVLHSIGFAPEACLGDDFMAAQWDDVAVALHVSAYSLKALADAFVPLMSVGRLVPRARLRQSRSPGRRTTGWAWPSRRSSRRAATWPRSSAPRASGATWSPPDRCKTMAAKSIPGFKRFEDVWDDRAPLGWDVTDSSVVAKVVRRLAVGLVPGHDGRDDPRRWRFPRRGCVIGARRRTPTTAPSPSSSSPGSAAWSAGSTAVPTCSAPAGWRAAQRSAAAAVVVGGASNDGSTSHPRRSCRWRRATSRPGRARRSLPPPPGTCRRSRAWPASSRRRTRAVVVGTRDHEHRTQHLGVALGRNAAVEDPEDLRLHGDRLFADDPVEADPDQRVGVDVGQQPGSGCTRRRPRRARRRAPAGPRVDALGDHLGRRTAPPAPSGTVGRSPRPAG